MSGLSRNDLATLKKIRQWAANLGDPLAVDVLDDLAERLDNHIHAGAIVRVRMKNRGNRKPRRMADPVVRPIIHDESSSRHPARLWSTDELGQLHRMFREGMRIEDIADSIGRSLTAVQAQVDRSGLRRARGSFKIGNEYKKNPHLAAVRRIKERRELEMSRPDYAEEVA